MMLMSRLSLVVASVALVMLVGVAQARPAATPSSVFDKYQAAQEKLANTTLTKLNTAADKTDAAIQKLIDADASDAKIIKAANAAILGFEKSIKAMGASLLKNANTTRKTLVKMQTAAERKGDDDTASQADDFIGQVDDDIDAIGSGVDEVVSALEQLRTQIVGAEDPGATYDDSSDDIETQIDSFFDDLFTSDSGA